MLTVKKKTRLQCAVLTYPVEPPSILRGPFEETAPVCGAVEDCDCCQSENPPSTAIA